MDLAESIVALRELKGQTVPLRYREALEVALRCEIRIFDTCYLPQLTTGKDVKIVVGKDNFYEYYKNGGDR